MLIYINQTIKTLHAHEFLQQANGLRDWFFTSLRYKLSCFVTDRMSRCLIHGTLIEESYYVIIPTVWKCNQQIFHVFHVSRTLENAKWLIHLKCINLYIWCKQFCLNLKKMYTTDTEVWFHTHKCNSNQWTVGKRDDIGWTFYSKYLDYMYFLILCWAS
jgi:hypothetical protein